MLSYSLYLKNKNFIFLWYKYLKWKNKNWISLSTQDKLGTLMHVTPGRADSWKKAGPHNTFRNLSVISNVHFYGGLPTLFKLTPWAEISSKPRSSTSITNTFPACIQFNCNEVSCFAFCFVLQYWKVLKFLLCWETSYTYIHTHTHT